MRLGRIDDRRYKEREAACIVRSLRCMRFTLFRYMNKVLTLFRYVNIICIYSMERSSVMILLTSSEMAKKWNISGRRIAILCSEGRIKDAVKKGKTWLIPSDAPKPSDLRKNDEGATEMEEVTSTNLSVNDMIDYATGKIVHCNPGGSI